METLLSTYALKSAVKVFRTRKWLATRQSVVEQWPMIQNVSSVAKKIISSRGQCFCWLKWFSLTREFLLERWNQILTCYTLFLYSCDILCGIAQNTEITRHMASYLTILTSIFTKNFTHLLNVVLHIFIESLSVSFCKHARMEIGIIFVLFAIMHSLSFKCFIINHSVLPAFVHLNYSLFSNKALKIEIHFKNS